MKSFRWSDIPKALRRKPQGKSLAQRARERESQREELRRDLERFNHAGANMIPEAFTGLESDPAADWLNKHFPGWTHEDWLTVNYLGQPPVEKRWYPRRSES